MPDQQNNKNDQPQDQDPEGPGKGPQPPPPMKFTRGIMSWVIIISALILLFIVLNSSPRGTPIESWKEFVRLIDPDQGKIEKNLVIV